MTMQMALVLGVVLALAACGSADGIPDAAGTTSATGSSSYAEDLTITSPAGRGRPITVRGAVGDGVEAGCLTITDAQGTWTLVGATAGLKAGDTVTVRGEVREDLATTCQQGPALWVDEVLER